MDPSFTHLHGTNNVPSNSELARLKFLLSPAEAELSRLENEMKEATEKMMRLNEEMKAIRKRVQPLKAISSLIRRLPREIMELIFLFSRAYHRESSLQMCDAPLLLLRICRPWRDIALSTSELWASFYLTVPTHLSTHTADMESAGYRHKLRLFSEEIRRWLTRSGNTPLSISIHQRHQPNPHNQFYTSIILEFLKHSQRLKSFEIEVNDSVLYAVDASIDADALPNLSTLGIRDKTYNSADRIFTSNNLLKAANVKSFHFSAIYTRSFTDLPLKWGKLTSLSLGGSQSDNPFNAGMAGFEDTPFSAIEALTILRYTSSLQSCSFRFPDTQELSTHTQHDLRPILLKALRIFGLKGPPNHLDILLKAVETPLIQEFNYLPLAARPRVNHNHFGIAAPPNPPPPTPSLTSLIDYLRRCGSQITTLSFDYSRLANDEFVTCLESVPAVKHLTIGRKSTSIYHRPSIHSDKCFNDSHLALFTPKPDCLCPNMEFFHCNVKCRVTEGAIMAFLKAKLDPDHLAAGVGRIKEIEMHSLQLDFPLTRWTMETSKPIREAGVKMTFWKPHYYHPTLVTREAEDDFED